MVDIAATAGKLIEARKSDSIVTLDDYPADLDEAYRVQRAVAAGYGEQVIGWKAAFTADAAMEMMKTHEPAYGPLFADWSFVSGDTMASPEHCLRRIECEYAFKMGKTFAPRAEEYSNAEVTEAVASVHPAIEVVHVRADGALGIGARAVVADHCGNYAFVTGDGQKEWHTLDIVNQPVTLTVDGEEAVAGAGKNVLGHPVTSLVWLVNRLSADGLTLEAGQFITTGSCTGMHPVPQTCELVADFGPLGQCALTCSA
jgi:2-keto-4-pentenoate hydratase